MSYLLFWEKAVVPNRVVPTFRGDDDERTIMKRMEETFGANRKHPLAPIELSKRDTFTLRQMGSQGTYYSTIADLIDANGQIRIWGRD